MKTTYILAAVDRFPEDDAVLARGMEIAACHDVVLTIVHVIDLPDHAAAPALINTFRGQAEVAARERIEAALSRQGIDRADTEIHIKTGPPALRLAEVCDVFRPALVVMRAHHKPWIIRKLLGSTTERLIAKGTAPVLVVRQAVGRPYGHVLLAVDGPDSAPKALSLVAALLPGSAFHMVQALQVPRQLEEAMLRVGLPRSELSAHHDVLVRNAERRLHALAADLVPRVTWQVLPGEPAVELVRATQGTDVDLIALGPNRSGLIQRAFIGSVTRRLLCEAACDVLVGGSLDALITDVAETHKGAAGHIANHFQQRSI